MYNAVKPTPSKACKLAKEVTIWTTIRQASISWPNRKPTILFASCRHINRILKTEFWNEIMRHTSPISLADYPRTVSCRSIAQFLTASVSEVRLHYISRLQQLPAGTDVSEGSVSGIRQHLAWCRYVTLNMEATHSSENIVSQPKVNFIGQIFQTNGTFCAFARLILNWVKNLAILNFGSNCSCTDCTWPICSTAHLKL